MMKKIIFIIVVLLSGTKVYSSSNKYLGPVLPSPVGCPKEMVFFETTLIVPSSTQLEKWQHFVKEHANEFTQIDLTYMDYNTSQCTNKKDILADLAVKLNNKQFPGILLNVEMGYVPLDKNSQKYAEMIQQSTPYLGPQSSVTPVIPERAPLSPVNDDSSDSDDEDFTVSLQCPAAINPNSSTSPSKSPIELGDSPTLPEDEQ